MEYDENGQKVNMTQLIPQLQEILETAPKRLNLACADLVADYDGESQEAFIEMCGVEGYQINKAAMQHIIPPVSAAHGGTSGRFCRLAGGKSGGKPENSGAAKEDHV